MNLADIVKTYSKYYAAENKRYLQYYQTRRTLKEAVEKSALAELPNGKRYSHQYRIPHSVLVKAKKALLKVNLINCKTFDELHQLVTRKIGLIHGIGELTIYDTAHRLGSYLNLEPEYVYLHAGTRAGAKALNPGFKSKKLIKAELPPEFQKLSPDQIEDCLCIFESDLAALRTGKHLVLTKWKGKCKGSLKKLGCRSVEEYLKYTRGR
jgi:hypothetical protein